jgi:DNA polymerase I-like protein with 3'-5' exonuclease and polymerase domains
MYRAPEGKLLCAFDLSAAEAWVVAHLANDFNMKRELKDGDLHSFTGCGIYDIKVPDGIGKKRYEGIITKDQRYIGKKVNHSGNYRAGPFNLAASINEDGKITISVADAKRFHDKWLKTYSLHTWWADIDERLQRNRTFVTEYGHRRQFWGIMGDKLKKEATAYEPQSTVADHMHGAIHPQLGVAGGNLLIFKKIVEPSKGEIIMTNTAHDSVMLEVPLALVDSVVPEAVSYLKRPLIIRGEEFTIPVDAEVGERWGELEKRVA